MGTKSNTERQRDGRDGKSFLILATRNLLKRCRHRFQPLRLPSQTEHPANKTTVSGEADFEIFGAPLRQAPGEPSTHPNSFQQRCAPSAQLPEPVSKLPVRHVPRHGTVGCLLRCLSVRRGARALNCKRGIVEAQKIVGRETANVITLRVAFGKLFLSSEGWPEIRDAGRRGRNSHQGGGRGGGEGM